MHDPDSAIDSPLPGPEDLPALAADLRALEAPPAVPAALDAELFAQARRQLGGGGSNAPATPSQPWLLRFAPLAAAASVVVVVAGFMAFGGSGAPAPSAAPSAVPAAPPAAGAASEASARRETATATPAPAPASAPVMPITPAAQRPTIVDALRLARQLESGTAPAKLMAAGLDHNGDGAVDFVDVEHLAAQAVALAPHDGPVANPQPPIQDPQPQATVRFTTVDIYLDTKGIELAAWQLEFAAETGAALVLGIEGGKHPAFKSAPKYDPKALQGGRVILASFSTGAKLPAGRILVARLHLQVRGAQPRFVARVTAASTRDGAVIPATVTLVPGE